MATPYQYDTRGASHSSQIINLERMLEERDTEIERLRLCMLSASEALGYLLAIEDDGSQDNLEYAKYLARKAVAVLANRT